MTALLAYLGVTVLTWTVVVFIERRSGPPSPRATPWDLADNARKQVTVLAGLSGFAITNIVLLVTFAANRAEVRTDSFDSLLALLIVAYFSYVSTGLMYATLVRGGDDGDPETQKLQYAIATTQHYRGIFLGWLSLAPLLDAFGLDQLSTLLSGLLLSAALVGWVFQSAQHVRLGYLHLRHILVGPVLALGVAFVTAVALRMRSPDAPSGDSILYLATVAFALGGASFALGPIVSLAADYPRARARVQREAHLIIAVLSQATLVLLGFLWLGVVGLI